MLPRGESALEQEVLSAYEQYSPFLMRFARSLAPDRAAAQDALQEVFFQYFIHRRNGNVVEDARGWFVLSLRRILEKSDSPPEPLPAPPAPEGISPQEFSDALLDVEKRVPHLLSARESEVLRMRAQGLRYVDIARTLNVTTGTIGTMVARAMRKLQAEFRPNRRGGSGAVLEEDPKLSS